MDGNVLLWQVTGVEYVDDDEDDELKSEDDNDENRRRSWS
jgi:hypothetical protein